MRCAIDPLFSPKGPVRNGDDLDAARGIGIGSLFGALAWLLVVLALSLFISCR